VEVRPLISTVTSARRSAARSESRVSLISTSLTVAWPPSGSCTWTVSPRSRSTVAKSGFFGSSAPIRTVATRNARFMAWAPRYRESVAEFAFSRATRRGGGLRTRWVALRPPVRSPATHFRGFRTQPRGGPALDSLQPSLATHLAALPVGAVMPGRGKGDATRYDRMS
jgi:hypothetical protein